MAASWKTNTEISDSFHISECSDSCHNSCIDEYNGDVNLNCNCRTQNTEFSNETFDKSEENTDENITEFSLYENINDIRKQYANHVIVSHLNVNSVGPKITEIRELQKRCQLDILVLSESKLDESYKQDVIDIEGYNCVRQDKRGNSGGILTYISKDIPFSLGNIQLCNDEIECLSIELNIKEEKIMLLCMYKNPRTDPVTFKKFFEETCESVSNLYENIIIIGDLNFNMFQDNMLAAIIPPFNMTNIIKDATCFKSKDPTLIDVMLVTKRRKFINHFSKNTGISDFHNLIGGIMRMHKPVPRTKRVSYRKLSSIDYDKVLEEMSGTDLSMQIMNSKDASSAYDKLQVELCNLLDRHAPKKQRVIRKNDFHVMSKQLRKAIYHRNRLRNKYYKFRTVDYLNMYKAQRNKVTLIKRKEICQYFEDKCKEGTRNKDFWKAVKPLFSKSRTKSDTIPLRENGEIVTEDQKVCEIFNTFFQTIGSDIGAPESNRGTVEEIINPYDGHSSVETIRQKIKSYNEAKFIFRFVSEREVAKVINSLSKKKAAGYDELPVQFIKNLGRIIVKPMTLLINRCILENKFPNQMKKANITPLFKKKDKLNKDNYRSVNLLPILSKVLERILYNQVYEYISPLFHNYLSGFRKGHSCQDVLVRMTEDWREHLDKGSNIGVVAIDLSKAFDCMPHGLLLAKLSAYGFDNDACKLMKSYVMERKQRVKIGETFSDWVYNIKGVPQGSILGPLLFNIFINDFLFSDFNSKIYNYADDNTLCYEDNDQTILSEKLTEDCIKAMRWFEVNNMKANASKFQVMFVSRHNNNNRESITINNTEIKASHSINILGVEIDRELRFNSHIDGICSQTGKQVNAVKRLKHFLDKKSKMIIYNSYINCNFHYCSLSWMFANKTSLDKLENTNKRALRVVTNNGHLSYEELCEQEKQLTVYKRCLKAIAILIYKIKIGTAPQYLRDLFTVHDSEYDMRDNDRLILPLFNTVRFGKTSIRYLGAKLWNYIPVEIKSKASLSTFKPAVHKWLISCRMENVV